jgi:polyhydroxybutyrate depolymerase
VLEYLRRGVTLAWLAAAAAACESGSSGPGPQVPEPAAPVAEPEPSPAPVPNEPPALTGNRIPLTHTNLFVPEGAGPSARVPFVLLLHGLGMSGEGVVNQLVFTELARKRRFAFVAPDGSPSITRGRFWNGFAACCDFDQLKPDHVYLLGQLLREVAKHPAIDPRRLYVLGYSNGGFMAHRLACEVPGIAAIASMAGSGPGEGEVCRPAAPVSVLQVHGDADVAIRYGGGPAAGSPNGVKHPAAEAVIAAWASRNGCGTPAEAPTSLDFEPDLPDAETQVIKYPGCRRDTELWRIKGGGHLIALKWPALEQVLAFLERSRSD